MTGETFGLTRHDSGWARVRRQQAEVHCEVWCRDDLCATLSLMRSQDFHEWGRADLTDAEVADLVRDDGAYWHVSVEGIDLDTGPDESEDFPTRDRALEAASEVMREIKGSRIRRLPEWRRDDIAEYLRWFKAQDPNRYDYFKLFCAADHNGSFESLLRLPIAEAEELFMSMFEDDLHRRCEGKFS